MARRAGRTPAAREARSNVIAAVAMTTGSAKESVKSMCWKRRAARRAQGMPNPDAEKGHHKCFAENQAKNAVALRAQRHPDADFAGAEGDRVS
jgi:hypothetical protein